MREMLNKDNQNLATNSFLLDDDLRYDAIYFTLDFIRIEALGTLFPF